MKTIVLDSTNKTLKAKLSGAPATTNPDFVVSWADSSATAFAEGASDGALNGSTEVTLVDAPAASTRRVIKDISVVNRDTAPVTLYLYFANTGTNRILAKVTLAVGDVYTLDGTFDASGSLKGIGAPGADGTNGADGADGQNGADGVTPHIGINGNWYIGATDTGIAATGPKGDTGAAGAKGDTGDTGAKGDTGATGAAGANGQDGQSAYVYIAYASDSSGTGLSTSPSASLNYIAVKTTTSPIASPQASDFTGLWKQYANASATGEIWTALTGTYASTTTFTFTGTDKDVKLIQLSLLTCTDSAGTTLRIGYVKSAVNNSGTITATVVTNSDLASGDKDFKVAYNRKVKDYQHDVKIPGELMADTGYSQGWWHQDIEVDSYLLPVDTSVLTAAAGTGAALTYNVYANTSNMFSSAPDMTTNTVLRSQRPTTNTISAGNNLSLRIMSSAGGTNKAADFQAKLFIVPQNLFTAF